MKCSECRGLFEVYATEQGDWLLEMSGIVKHDVTIDVSNNRLSCNDCGPREKCGCNLCQEIARKKNILFLRIEEGPSHATDHG